MFKREGEVSSIKVSLLFDLNNSILPIQCRLVGKRINKTYSWVQRKTYFSQYLQNDRRLQGSEGVEEGVCRHSKNTITSSAMIYPIRFTLSSSIDSIEYIRSSSTNQFFKQNLQSSPHTWRVYTKNMKSQLWAAMIRSDPLPSLPNHWSQHRLFNNLSIFHRILSALLWFENQNLWVTHTVKNYYLKPIIFSSFIQRGFF